MSVWWWWWWWAVSSCVWGIVKESSQLKLDTLLGSGGSDCTKTVAPTPTVQLGARPTPA